MNLTPALLNIRVGAFRVLKHHLCSAASDIVPPKRIPRSSTDILQALSTTIIRDSTAAHYKYHDDPYLIPMSNIGKRTFAMAQEAGRKAAHWIRQEHSELFQHSAAEPAVDMFIPHVQFNENSFVSEDILQGLIRSAEVGSAITVYELLLKKGECLSVDTLQSLLEVLCFYNGSESIYGDFIEEIWFRNSSKSRDRLRKTWKDDGISEKIFRELPDKNGTTYGAIIQGMTKYCQVDNAWRLYQEARQGNVPLCTSTYNSLIKIANFLKEGHDLRWNFVQEMLRTMASEGLKPNVGTLNAVLETLSTMAGHRMTKTYVLQTLSEFKQLGIEPSLASWYYTLIIFCRERGPVSTILWDIITHIEGQKFEIQDPKDTYFFVTAMDVCRHHLRDKDLADKVHELLLNDNYDLIGDSYKESIYYRHYLALLVNTEPLEVFMQRYNKIVPNIYIPEPGIMGEILKVVEMNCAIEYVPKIWSDMVLFDQTDREGLLQVVLNIMASSDVEDQELVDKFCEISWEVWKKIEGQSEDRTRRINFTGKMLGDILSTCVRANDFSKACRIMEKLEKAPHDVVGVPEYLALQKYTKMCIEHRQPSRAIDCLQYCVDNGYTEAGLLACEINTKLTLDSTHLNKIITLVGKDVLESVQT